jgi:ketosteroid isomerase-like protein
MISSAGEAAEVLRIETQWAECALKGDTAGLSSIYSDDLKYVHATGVVDTKQGLLSAIESRAAVYQSIDSEDMDVRVIGDVAVVTSRARIQVKIGGQELKFQALFLRVYLKGNGSWRLAYHQGTRLS